MKKLFKVMSLMLAMVFLCAACTSKDSADTSLSDIKSKGVIVMGLDPAFPPMGFADADQSIVGFDIDVAKAVCEKMGIELKLQPIDWDSKENELNTKAVDCLWNGFSYSDKRNEELTLSQSYMGNKQVAVVLADSSVNTLADLKGKTVVVQSGSTAEEAIEGKVDFKKSLKEVVSVKDNVQALYDLGSKDSDCVVMDEVVARYYTEMKPGKYKILNESLADEKYVIGFRKGDTSLCKEVEKHIKALAADGTLAKISTEWFGKDITTIK